MQLFDAEIFNVATYFSLITKCANNLKQKKKTKKQKGKASQPCPFA
jgi:hypothetical protein